MSDGKQQAEVRLCHLHPHHAGKALDALTDPASDEAILVRRAWRNRTGRPGSSWRLEVRGRPGRPTPARFIEASRRERLVIRWRNEFKPELKAEGFTRCTMTIEPTTAEGGQAHASSTRARTATAAASSSTRCRAAGRRYCRTSNRCWRPARWPSKKKRPRIHDRYCRVQAQDRLRHLHRRRARESVAGADEA